MRKNYFGAVIVSLLTLLTACTEISSKNNPAINQIAPSELRSPANPFQQNEDGSSINNLDLAKSNFAKLSARSSNAGVNFCKWQYRLELELRPANEKYIGYPNYLSDYVGRSRQDSGVFSFPMIEASNLSWETTYKWRMREHSISYLMHYDNRTDTYTCSYLREGSSNWVNGSSFSTPKPTTTVRAYPDTVEISTGSLRNGDEIDLIKADSKYLQVDANTGGESVTSWEASFINLRSKPVELEITYLGKSQRRCEQTLSIWNWNNSFWDEIDRRLATNTATPVLTRVPKPLSPYINQDGKLKTQTKCVRDSRSFFISADQLFIDYESSN